jgi:localization factor PodJL
MASEASWQSGGSARHGDSSRNAGALDQQSVESLLRRLVERVEESERRYSEALDELHSRLDQLSHSTEAAAVTTSPEDADTLHRLHDQVSSLARRLEHETELPLDDFERLGRVLTGSDSFGGEAGRPEGETPAFGGATDALSFWQRPAQTYEQPSFGARSDFASATPYSLESLDNGLDKRLVEIARRLEDSIGSSMPATAIEAINKKMDDIAAQLDRALNQPSGKDGLEHVERQISDMAQQLNRAENQIARLGGIEDQLHKLIERVDAMPSSFAETAKTTAGDVARHLAEQVKPADDRRLQAIEGKIAALGDESRASTQRLSETVAAVHASLKELLQQFEKGPSPFARGPRTPVPDRLRDETRGQPALKTPDAERPAQKTTEPRKETPKPPEPEVKDRSLRSRLGAAIPDFEEREAQASFGRARAKLDEEAVDLDAADALTRAPTAEADRTSTEDLVAAARRAAQAAAAEAEKRGRRGGARIKAGAAAAADASQKRSRPLLMIMAALLLVVSASLLYARLKSKPEPETVPTQTEETVPAPEQKHGIETPGEKSGGIDAPPVRYGGATSSTATPAKGITEVTKSRRVGGLVATGSLKAQPASLTFGTASELPDGVSISVEDGSPALSQVQGRIPSKVGMPPASLAPFALRQAAAGGDAKAQFAVALRYLEAEPANFAEAARWLGYAASAGLAPAQYRLATMYERGQGLSKDAGRARSWYEAAAEKGNVKAMHNLAVSESGRAGGATPDYGAARQWYLRAAAYGLADSQFNLGILAEHGLGMKKDPAEAYKWFALAAASGDAEATKRRDAVKAEIEGSALANAEASVQSWKPQGASREANEVDQPEAWLGAADAASASTATTQASAALQGSPSPTLSGNAELVLRTQRLLNKLGYDVGAPDGELGERTREAIRTFQERNGIPASGEVTVPLVTKLERLTS